MVLLVIDTQKLIMTDKLYRFEELISSIKTLINTARENNIEVIFARHDDGEGKPLSKGTDGYEIYDEFSPLEGEKIIDKTVNSPFGDTGLLEYLDSYDEETLIVAGLQTDYCIDAAVKCGFEYGFEMIVPVSANSTFDNAFMSAEDTCRYYNEFIWNNRYARCLSLEETLEIMRKANETPC